MWWSRGGVELYESAIRLPSGGQVNVALASSYAAPGSYEVQLRHGDGVLVERRV